MHKKVKMLDHGISSLNTISPSKSHYSSSERKEGLRRNKRRFLREIHRLVF